MNSRISNKIKTIVPKIKYQINCLSRVDDILMHKKNHQYFLVDYYQSSLSVTTRYFDCMKEFHQEKSRYSECIEKK